MNKKGSPRLAANFGKIDPRTNDRIPAYAIVKSHILTTNLLIEVQESLLYDATRTATEPTDEKILELDSSEVDPVRVGFSTEREIREGINLRSHTGREQARVPAIGHPSDGLPLLTLSLGRVQPCSATGPEPAILTTSPVLINPPC